MKSLQGSLPRMKIFAVVATLLLLLQISSAESIASQPVTIFYQPVSSTEISPIASIDYDIDSLYTQVTSYTPPNAGDTTNEAETSHPLLRIFTGTPEGSTTITSLSTFNPSYTQTLTLHVNEDGLVFAAAFSADPLSSPPLTSNKPADNLKVVLLLPKPGPIPKLNGRKPVVVDADGKEIPQVQEVEKSFFQKYWWAFALVAVVALAGGGDK